MEISIQKVLENRIKAYESNTLESHFKLESKEYSKKWAQAVQFFQKKINSDRQKDKMPILPFIVVRQKLVGVKEIDDLRWFYGECLKYERKRDKFGRPIRENTFSRCFFGALK